jgi:UrcA family protein
MLKTLMTTVLIFAAAPALANAPRAAHVSVADLNLASSHGVAELDRRLDRAAKTVCAAGPATDLRTTLAAHTCLNKTRATVAAQRNAVIAAANVNAPVRIASAR